MSPRPFEQLPFEELPLHPHRSHPFFELKSQELSIASSVFGPHRVHVRSAGEGPPLLLVHGLMTSNYSFRYLFPLLSSHYRVIAPDLPGAGRSDKPATTYTAPKLASWIGEVVDALGLERPLCVGNSLGGYLCMRAALEQPQLFSKLVNIHSPAKPEERLRLLKSLLASGASRRVLSRVIARSPERWAHRNVHYYDESLKSVEEAQQYGAPLSSQQGRDAFISYLAQALDPDELDVFLRQLQARRRARQAFPVPLLLLYARQDALVSPRNGELLKSLVTDAKLRWLEDTSHFAHVDTPELVADELQRFLGAVTE